MMIQVELSNSNRLHQLRIIMCVRRKIDRSIAPRVCSVYRKKLSREFSLCTLVSTELKFYIASRLNMLQSDDVVVVMVGDKLQVTEELQQTKEENTHRWWKHGAL